MIRLSVHTYRFCISNWLVWKCFRYMYIRTRKIPNFEFDIKNFVFCSTFFQMALNLLVIVEFGAQKQRISLNANSCYQDICNQIYSLFKLDFNKSKYILQRQDSFKPELFHNIDDRLFMNDLKYYATNNIKNPVIRLRLVPPGFKNSVNKKKTLIFLYEFIFFFFSKI